MLGIHGLLVSPVSNLFDIARFCFYCMWASIWCGPHFQFVVMWRSCSKISSACCDRSRVEEEAAREGGQAVSCQLGFEEEVSRECGFEEEMLRAGRGSFARVWF